MILLLLRGYFNSVIIYSPSSLLQTFMSFFLLLNTWNSMEVYGSKVPIVLLNIFLCAQQKKETHTGLQQLEGE